MAYAGFDTFAFPGDAAMDWLRQNTNLKWVGFYLVAPSHPNGSWLPHIARVKATGWGTAPVYVGQQTQGPGRHTVTAAQGTADGADAAHSMHALGYAPRSFVSLDLENGRPFTPAQRAYVAAWVASVEANGYGAGVYCSFTFAGDVAGLVPSARIWAFRVPTVARHNVQGQHFPDGDPSSSGYVHAAMWQCQQNANIHCAPIGVLTVYLDTSVYADPSAPNQTAPAVDPAGIV